jgi:DNA primase
MYKCFVCDEGGDAINFVKEFKKIDFIESLKTIASILGLHFEELKKEKKSPKFEMAQRVLNASNKLYLKIAEKKPKAFVEFVEKRKLSPESIQTFQIGYAPGNNGLTNYLQSIPHHERELAVKTAIETGIIKFNSDRNSTYDFFRDRIMFPIHDHAGYIKGYSSRSIREDQIPKYLNSGDSFIFHKGSILFGLHFAKSQIRQLDQVILVEGNMDVIMMHQFGLKQTVGTMGTALSESSIKLISNMTKNIFLAMDSDSAGKKAMQRINADFMSHGLLPKFLDFSPSKDPDEFLNSFGRLALEEKIEKAPLLVDQLINEIIPPKINENIEAKLQLLNQVFEILSPLKDHLFALEKILSAAHAIGLKSDNTTIRGQYQDFLKGHKPKFSVPTSPKTQEKWDTSPDDTVALNTENTQLENISSSNEAAFPLTLTEKIFLKEVLCHPEFMTHLDKDDFLAIIEHDEVKRLIRWLITIYSEIDDAEYVSIVQDELQYGHYTKEVINIGTEALFNHGLRYNEKIISKMLKDFKLKLQMEKLKFQRKLLVENQRQASTQVEIDLILNDIAIIDKKIYSLKNSSL